MNAINKDIELIKNYNELIYLVALLQFRSGARISEILNIEIVDILDNNLVFIKALKGGNNYTLFVPEVDRIRQLSSSLNGKLFGSLNKSSVHRTYVKFGIIEQNKNNKNRTTTHLFRRLRAKEVHKKFDNEIYTKDILHHKSKKSQSFYLK